MPREPDYTVDGEPLKGIAVYLSDIQGRPGELFGRFDSYDEVLKGCVRLDKRFLVQAGREYIPLHEYKKRFAPKSL